MRYDYRIMRVIDNKKAKQKKDKNMRSVLTSSSKILSGRWGGRLRRLISIALKMSGAQILQRGLRAQFGHFPGRISTSLAHGPGEIHRGA